MKTILLLIANQIAGFFILQKDFLPNNLKKIIIFALIINFIMLIYLVKNKKK